MRIGFASTMLCCVLSIGACVGPGDRHTKSAQGSPSALTAAKIESDPSNIDNYRDGVMGALRAGEDEQARRIALLATQRLPNDYRAWLVKAQMERTLLDFEPCEASLQQALGLAPQAERIGVLSALADFYSDMLLHDLQLDYRKQAWKAASKLDNADLQRSTLAALALERAGLGRPHGLSDSEMQMLGAATQVGLLGPGVSDQTIDQLAADPTRANLAVLSRLVGFADKIQRVKIRASLLKILSEREDKDIRFACLLGLWLDACCITVTLDESFATHVDSYGGRLDEADAKHPQWVLRASLWDLVNGRRDAAEARAAGAGRTLDDLPFQPFSREDVLCWIRFEDALGMGWYDEALKELKNLKAEGWREGAFERLTTDILVAARRYPDVLQRTLPGTVESLPLRIPCLLALGQVDNARSEFDNAKESAQPASGRLLEQLQWIERLLEYRERRLLRSR